MVKILFLLLIVSSAYSQSINFFVINAIGASTAQLTSSVGETAIAVRSSVSDKITDGFLQSTSTVISTSLIKTVQTENSTCYPNPTSSSINMYGDYKHYQYQLLNVSGFVIQSGIITNNSIDISHVSAGIYNLIISNQSSSRTLKIVKQ